MYVYMYVSKASKYCSKKTIINYIVVLRQQKRKGYITCVTLVTQVM